MITTMEKKKTYIKPVTEVIVMHSEAMMAASNKFAKMATTYRYWEGDCPTTSQKWGIVNASADAVFTHGQSANGGGNRSKFDAWSAWDE